MIALALLVVSLVILIIRLFSPAQIQIVLETGQEVESQDAEYFTLSDVLLFIGASFVAGVTIMYLYLFSEIVFPKIRSQKEGSYDVILPFLKEDEKKVFLELMQENSALLQNELVRRTGLSKVRMTRVLAHLTQKGITIKERHGLTNKVRLQLQKQKAKEQV